VEVARVITSDVTTSVLDDVWKVKVLEVVADPPGERDIGGVSVPTPRVVVIVPGEMAVNVVGRL